MSDGVAARAGAIRARLAFSMVAYIFAYRAIIGAFSISGYVTCGATVIPNHHGVDARCRTVRISWLGVAKLATENIRCSGSVRVTLSQRKTSVVRF